MIGQISFADSVQQGIAKTEGDVSILQQLGATLVNFELGFAIVPGADAEPENLELYAYEVNDESIQVRGE